MKGYWITFYRSVSDPEALAAYLALAVPAIEAGGGRILARGIPSHVFEEGVAQRTVLVEFDGVEQARRTYESPAYGAALEKLRGAVEREVRILEGLAP